MPQTAVLKKQQRSMFAPQLVLIALHDVDLGGLLNSWASPSFPGRAPIETHLPP